MLKKVRDDFERLLRPPTPLEIAQEDLAESKREWLKARSAEEYAHHMSNYHAERIQRLEQFIQHHEESQCQSNQ